MIKVAKKITQLCLLATASTLIGCGGSAETETDPSKIDPQQPVSDWEMVWSDEFDGDTIDSQNWNHEVNCEGGGNQEKQCYTNSAANSYIADGILNIVALPAEEGAELPFTSARMTTRYKADFKYGRIEMRAKAPKGQGSWPAFWMMPTDEEYGIWPRSGEIDIFESVNLGVQNEDGSTENHIYGTLHYGKKSPDTGKSYQLVDGSNPADDFHTYAIEWQEGEIRWYMDDYLYATQRKSELRINGKGKVVGLKHRGWFTEYFDQFTGELTTYWDNAPFDKEFYLILNFAVGGDWPENVNQLGVDASAFYENNKFEVDYVRVYQCQQNPDTGKGCETVRADYDVEESDEHPTGALVIGKAPNPPVEKVPPVGGLPDFVVFENNDTEFVAGYWAASGDIAIEDVDAGGDHGIVKQFTFNTDEGLGYFQSSNTADVSAYTSLEFDVFVVADNGAEDFIIKMDCVHPCSSGDFPVAKPAQGVWTSYSIPLTDLVNNGGSVLDLSIVNTPLAFFPTWGNMNGFVAQIDNVRFTTPPTASVLDVFIDSDTEFVAGHWAASGDIAIEDVDAGGDHGTVKQFTFNTDEGLGYFQSTDTADVSAYSNLEFDVFVVTDTGASDFIIKMDCVHPCSSGDFPVAKPAQGVWTSYSIPLADLVDHDGSVLDLSIVNTPLAFFPTWGNMNGFVAQIDNVRFTAPPAGLEVFTDEDTDFVAGHWAASGDIAIEQVDAGGDHGMVKQFTFNTDEGLGYFQSTDTADVSAYTSLEFDVFVVADNGASDFIIKMDCVHPCSSGDFPVAKPAQGVWTSYSIPLADLVNHDGSVLDLSIVNTPLAFFPTWGNMNGFVAQIDNVRFK
ncbi:family 16 glycosylhydrolase [Colwelliaceae bacterium 6441]